MNNTTSATFIKLAQTPTVKSFVKEAKRVGYKVETWRFSDTGDTGDIYGYEVKDGDALVFKAMKVQPKVWGMTFSKAYWQEPSLAG